MHLKNSKIVVIKIGSALLVDSNKKIRNKWFSNFAKDIKKLIPYLKNDKKNDDEKINFILLNKIGKTTQPNKHKISVKELKNKIKFFNQY